MIRTIQFNMTREIFTVTFLREDEGSWYVSNEHVTDCQIPKYMFTELS
jgi:hypothetical protein